MECRGKWNHEGMKGESHSALCAGIWTCSGLQIGCLLFIYRCCFLLSVHLSRLCKFCSIKNPLWTKCLCSFVSLSLSLGPEWEYHLSFAVLPFLIDIPSLAASLSLPLLSSQTWLAGLFVQKICKISYQLREKCGGENTIILTYRSYTFLNRVIGWLMMINWPKNLIHSYFDTWLSFLLISLVKMPFLFLFSASHMWQFTTFLCN